MADFNFSFMGMDAKEQEMRLTRFERDLTAGKDICCLEGEVKAFPKILCKPFLMNYVGLIVCEKGYFCFDVDKKSLQPGQEKRFFFPKGIIFQ